MLGLMSADDDTGLVLLLPIGIVGGSTAVKYRSILQNK